MQLYSEEATAVIILFIAILTVAVSGFSPLPSFFLLVTTFISLFYLIWYRKTRLEDPVDSMVGFAPGHYLFIFAFVLNGSANLTIYLLWAILVLATFGYDLLNNLSVQGTGVKLTKMLQYCIIWGVIVFLFQSLIINGLELGETGILVTRTALIIAGTIWVGIGLFRINRTDLERRS
ncbi:hypothetical protein KGY71_03115 [Candidatus Bipolaricaulota bacterium]|nr:hypothetical protein [Candidatus Bipolaricaulota bacterium]